RVSRSGRQPHGSRRDMRGRRHLAHRRGLDALPRKSGAPSRRGPMTATNPDDSVLKVRRSIHVKASPQRVWGAFTTMERMDRWWGAKRGNPVGGQPTGQWLIAYEP